MLKHQSFLKLFCLVFVFAAGISPNINAQDRSTIYYVVINDVTTGPYDIIEMRRAIVDGKLKSEMLTWKTGMTIWQEAGSFPELNAIFNPITVVETPPANQSTPSLFEPTQMPPQNTNSPNGNIGTTPANTEYDDNIDFFSKLAISFGLGVFFNYDFNVFSFSDTDAAKTYKEQNDPSYNLLGIGANLFVDLLYVEIDLSYYYGSITYYNGTTNDAPTVMKKTNALRLGLLGKYPINMSDRFVLFPLLGASYEFVLSAVNANNDDVDFKIDGNDHADSQKALNSFWFKGGIGADLFLTNMFFLRLNALYGIRWPPNNWEKNLPAQSNKYITNVASHGLDIKLAFGIRL